MEFIDFLLKLSNTLPIPVIALLIGVVSVLAAMVLYAVVFLFILIIMLIPGTGFLFVNIEEKVGDSIQKRAQPSPSSHPDSKTRQLQNKLLMLLSGDVKTAKRLLAQQRQKNPGKTSNWYLEKVIYDLERDRRR